MIEKESKFILESRNPSGSPTADFFVPFLTFQCFTLIRSFCCRSTTDLVRSERVMAELDAAVSKKGKTEQVKMAKEACICLVSYKKLFVIKLSNLKKQEVDVKDWNCLPPPEFEFDFHFKLPKLDLCPFEFDSKIYMAVSEDPGRKGIVKDSCPIYEFKFGDGEGSFERAESLDDAPLPFVKAFIANTPGSGDVYFCMKSQGKASPDCYVLCSGSRTWKPLIAPPTVSNPPFRYNMFVLDNNLFLSSRGNRDTCLARFDPIKENWTTEPASENNLSNFIKDRLITGDNYGRFICLPYISVSLPGLGSRNYTVCLTNEFVNESPPEAPLHKVLAILVNPQNGRVALYQYLDECFEGIYPSVGEEARFNFVDLGNGKLCAILSGGLYGSKSNSLALCFSVFTLSVDFAALQLEVGAPPMERDFLQVTVHKKSAYTMGISMLSDRIRHAFVWPPSHVPKQNKLKSHNRCSYSISSVSTK
ncbi:uncharacterized protein LOC107613454 [Arachis ipaensis]|uniref:uncharacterized protein LOC107613454 n=1 Tax=Arachis ipaensis TaxID=130454 RepID=UPI0007AFBFE2|nr:uncharacterized protein LOC107613454 [Arachis ipaensis]